MNSWVGERNGAHAKTLSALRVMRARPLRNFQPQHPLDELRHLRAHKDVLEINLKGPKAAEREAIPKKIVNEEPQAYAMHYWVRPSAN